MIELLDRAEKYASGKASVMIDKAIAQAYADGYRDGYADREKEIPINLRETKQYTLIWDCRVEPCGLLLLTRTVIM